MFFQDSRYAVAFFRYQIRPKIPYCDMSARVFPISSPRPGKRASYYLYIWGNFSIRTELLPLEISSLTGPSMKVPEHSTNFSQRFRTPRGNGSDNSYKTASEFKPIIREKSDCYRFTRGGYFFPKWAGRDGTGGKVRKTSMTMQKQSSF